MPGGSGSVVVAESGGGVETEFPSKTMFWTDAPNSPLDWSWYTVPGAVVGTLSDDVLIDESMAVPSGCDDPAIWLAPKNPGTLPVAFDFDMTLTGSGSPHGAEAAFSICDEDIRAGLSPIGNWGGLYFRIDGGFLHWWLFQYETSSVTYPDESGFVERTAPIPSGSEFHVRLAYEYDRPTDTLTMTASVDGMDARVQTRTAGLVNDGPFIARSMYPRIVTVNLDGVGEKPGCSVRLRNLSIDGGWDEYGGVSGWLIDDFAHAAGPTSGGTQGMGVTPLGQRWMVPAGWVPGAPDNEPHPTQAEFEAAWLAGERLPGMGSLGTGGDYGGGTMGLPVRYGSTGAGGRAMGNSGPDSIGGMSYPAAEDCGATDTFTRTVATEWGTGDGGVPWVTSATFGNTMSVDGTRAVDVLAPQSRWDTADLSWPSTGSDDILLTGIQFTASAAPVDLGYQLNIEPDTLHAAYRVTMGVYDPSQQWQFLDASGWHGLSTPSFDLTQPFSVRIQCSATYFRVRGWQSSGTEPTDWDFESTHPDTAYIGGSLEWRAGNNDDGTLTLHLDSVDVAGVNRCTAVQFDDFNRTVADGLGDATPSGATWIVDRTWNGSVLVNGSQAVLSLDSGGSEDDLYIVPPVATSYTLDVGFTCPLYDAEGGPFNPVLYFGLENGVQAGDTVSRIGVAVTPGWPGDGPYNSCVQLYGDTTEAFSLDMTVGLQYRLRMAYDTATGLGSASVWPVGTPDPVAPMVSVDASSSKGPVLGMYVYGANTSSAVACEIAIDFIDFHYPGRPAYLAPLHLVAAPVRAPGADDEPNQCLRLTDAAGSPINLWDLITDDCPFVDLHLRFVWGPTSAIPYPKPYDQPWATLYLCNAPSIANWYYFGSGEDMSNMVQYIYIDFFTRANTIDGWNWPGGVDVGVWPTAERYWDSSGSTTGGPPDNQRTPRAHFCGPETALSLTWRIGKDPDTGKAFSYGAIWNTDSAPWSFDSTRLGTTGAVTSAGQLIGVNGQSPQELKYLEVQLQLDRGMTLQLDEVHIVPGGVGGTGETYTVTGSAR